MGGITAARAVASGLPVQAMVLDSTPASVAEATQMRIERRGYPLALPASWAVMLGALFRTGVDVTAADPAITLDDIGSVPVLIVQGSDDQAISADSATRLAQAAADAGTVVETQVCDGGRPFPAVRGVRGCLPRLGARLPRPHAQPVTTRGGR